MSKGAAMRGGAKGRRLAGKVRNTARKGAADGLGARILVALIDFYRQWISPLKPPTCRYRPTCSQYAKEAILRYGPWRGGFMAFRRVMRCHPLRSGGWDPVP